MTDSFKRRMELGKDDRRRLLRWMRPGIVLEIGSGTGEFLELIAKEFPESEIYGIERDPERVMSARKLVPRARIYCSDVLQSRPPEHLIGRCSCVLMNAVFHEVEMVVGQDGTRDILALVRDLLSESGVFVFRDGVKPIDKRRIEKVRLKSEFARGKFERFFGEYRHRPIEWSRDIDCPDLIHVSTFDLHDVLNKYFLEDELWEGDMYEAFGTLDEGGYRRRFEEFFELVHTETYLAPYLEALWQEDIEILGRKFPDSHFIAVGRLI